MRRYICFAAVLATVFSGCASRPPSKAGSAAPRVPSYQGLRARIAVNEFETPEALKSELVGAGLREMLVTGLSNSGRFAVVDGTQKGPAAGPADLTVTAAVLEFKPQASGGAAGIGGGGGVGSGLMGGLMNDRLNKAHMSLSIRVVDTATSGVLSSTTVQGQAADVSGGYMAGFFGGWRLGGGLDAYADTPMEKAIRICMVEAVRHISQGVPEKYFEH